MSSSRFLVRDADLKEPPRYPGLGRRVEQDLSFGHFKNDITDNPTSTR
jgi:hypothetical protein